MRGCLITATDTGAGKTVLAAAIVAALAASGERVRAHKPVITGLDEPSGPWPPDDVLLARVAGMTRAEVAPHRFGPPCSPHLAAALSGERLDPGLMLAEARRQGSTGTLVVEGVGGLLVPLDAGYTLCDLAVELALPVLIAARPGLGTINHTLLTLAVARAAGLDVRAVVLTPWPAVASELELSNRETIAELGAIEVATLAPVASPRPELLARAAQRLPYARWLGATGEAARQRSVRVAI
jgi:dethiobiotin synthetase